ncbi:hypothetical protein Patl_0959 [Paraglaciecola sp. T6c]|uniref:outer membrane lipoprotein-sorting protein n=1 Tax=Pseudoalteromonas atlantica (strain T6c / ATCC BAA-1087) TaxID=3042615 RepID=UPI00005C5BDF|nr:outer membrane lipoprotein-sorting protein [Paraglaciecola sp. T6c]ABG39485.1 hypothetical protein Patl_0959 [Paraglaciecola sp. T6c]
MKLFNAKKLPTVSQKEDRMSRIFMCFWGCCLLAMHAVSAQANTQLSALELANNVVARAANDGRAGNMHFTLHNDAGGVRKRSALFVHSVDQGDTKMGIYFTAPAALQNTGFLSYDKVSGSDENWLYLPATDRVRKLPASSKGNYFMGTDLTYGDIKDNFKFTLTDWDFTVGEKQVIEQKEYYVLKGTTKTTAKKVELGYSSFIALIDPETYFPLKIDYTDTDGLPLKTISVKRLERIADAWVATNFTVMNAQLAHRTDVVLSDVKHIPDLPESILSADELSYGVPNIAGL